MNGNPGYGVLGVDPLEQDQVLVDPGEGKSIRLASISNVAGINQLATNQTLSFILDGLTAV